MAWEPEDIGYQLDTRAGLSIKETIHVGILSFVSLRKKEKK
jgi:hypothetical protein